MKPTFEIPELLNLDGSVFGDFLAADPNSCVYGCASGCRSGCDTGSGSNDKPPI